MPTAAHSQAHSQDFMCDKCVRAAPTRCTYHPMCSAVSGCTAPPHTTTTSRPLTGQQPAVLPHLHQHTARPYRPSPFGLQANAVMPNKPGANSSTDTLPTPRPAAAISELSFHKLSSRPHGHSLISPSQAQPHTSAPQLSPHQLPPSLYKRRAPHYGSQSQTLLHSTYSSASYARAAFNPQHVGTRAWQGTDWPAGIQQQHSADYDTSHTLCYVLCWHQAPLFTQNQTHTLPAALQRHSPPHRPQGTSLGPRWYSPPCGVQMSGRSLITSTCSCC